MENAIIKLLSESTTPLSPQDIAKGVGMKPPTAKSVNPTLYKMLKDGRLTKTSNPNGSSPKWSLSSKTGEVKASLPVIDTPLDKDILTFLTKQTSSLPAITICKQVLELEDGTANMVNPSLYSLLSKGLIEKVTLPDSNQPQWRIAGSKVPTSSPIIFTRVRFKPIEGDLFE